MTSDPSRPDAPPESHGDVVAELLRAAGRREEPPEEVYRLTLDVARAAWHDKVRRVQRRRTALWALAAGLVVAAVGIAVLIQRPLIDEAVSVARLELAIGSVEVRGSRLERWRELQPAAEPLRAGSVLRTSEGSGAALALASGASLRIDSATQIALDSGTRVRLYGGRVYVDSGARQNESEAVEIATPAGVARDVGTQFEVRYAKDAYRVRVREGRVRIQRDGRDLESVAGEELAIDATGVVRRARITGHDADWHWAEALAPVPDLDGQPVTTLLAWVGRETGRSVRFQTPEIELQARQTILHGELDGLAPLEALEVMLATTDLSYAILGNGTILVGVRAEEPIRSDS